MDFDEEPIDCSEISDEFEKVEIEECIRQYDGEYDMSYTGKLQQINGYAICETEIAARLLKLQSKGKKELLAETNGLFGCGIYLYDGNYPILLSDEHKSNKVSMQNPIVLGVKINVMNCLDLLECDNQHRVIKFYNDLKAKKVKTKINDTYIINEVQKQYKFDSIRGLITDSQPLYKESRLITCHIEICIKNPDCIQGYFIQQV